MTSGEVNPTRGSVLPHFTLRVVQCGVGKHTSSSQRVCMQVSAVHRLLVFAPGQVAFSKPQPINSTK